MANFNQVNLTPKELILNCSQIGLKILSQNKNMPSGHNGPYLDPETPVRNNAHWAMLFIKSFSLTKDEKYLLAAKKCINFLKETINDNYMFECRLKKGKDSVNGLIGQAWAIEPFAFIQKYDEDMQALELGINLINNHKYDESKSLWFKNNLEGQPDNLDFTFNHQLWFAAVASKLGKYDQKIEANCKDFLENIEKNIQIHKSGRIIQGLRINFFESSFKPFLKKFIRKKQYNYNLYKEIGYHAFNTYAFGLLYKSFPKHSFWDTDIFKKIIKYLDSIDYLEKIYESKYGFPYNPPGIEVLATSMVFKDKYRFNSEIIKHLWEHQMKMSINKENGLFMEGSFDKNTHMARAYEAILCI